MFFFVAGHHLRLANQIAMPTLPIQGPVFRNRSTLLLRYSLPARRRDRHDEQGRRPLIQPLI